MKSLQSIFLSACFITVMACSSNKEEKKPEDSMEAAEQMNEPMEKTEVDEDVTFAMEVADANMLEVKLGQLAQSNSSDKKVQELGMMMVDDHSKSLEELRAVGAQKSIALPLELSKDKQESYDKLAAKTGKNFDKEYTECMVKNHKKSIEAFEKEAEKGKDADLKSWAAAKLPVLRHHLEMSQSTEDAVKK